MRKKRESEKIYRVKISRTLLELCDFSRNQLVRNHGMNYKQNHMLCQIAGAQGTVGGKKKALTV